jgi:hypothetical protein
MFASRLRILCSMMLFNRSDRVGTSINFWNYRFEQKRKVGSGKSSPERTGGGADAFGRCCILRSIAAKRELPGSHDAAVAVMAAVKTRCYGATRKPDSGSTLKDCHFSVTAEMDHPCRHRG